MRSPKKVNVVGGGVGLSRMSLEEFLLDNIPLLRHMGVRVRRAGAQGVVLAASLAPNINQHGTAFGGSLAAVAVVAAWSALHMRLLEAGLSPVVVVQRHTAQYFAPVKGAFAARAAVEEGDAWRAFAERVQQGKSARIRVEAELVQTNDVSPEIDAARFVGDFAALAAQP